MSEDQVLGEAKQAQEEQDTLGDVIEKADETWQEAKDKLDDLDDKIDEMKDQLDRDADDPDDVRKDEPRASPPA